MENTARIESHSQFFRAECKSSLSLLCFHSTRGRVCRAVRVFRRPLLLLLSCGAARCICRELPHLSGLLYEVFLEFGRIWLHPVVSLCAGPETLKYAKHEVSLESDDEENLLIRLGDVWLSFWSGMSG